MSKISEIPDKKKRPPFFSKKENKDIIGEHW